MNDSVCLFGVNISCSRAKEQFKQMLEYLNGDGLHVCEIVSQDQLLEYKSDPEWVSMMNTADLCLFYNRKMMEAGGITDLHLAEELDRQTMWRMISRYIARNDYRLFLVVDSGKNPEQVLDSIPLTEHEKKKIRLSIITDESQLDSGLVNEINISDSDIVIAVLPSLMEERFITRYRGMLHAKLWIGCSQDELLPFHKKGWLTRTREMILGKFILRERKKENELL